MTRFPVQMSPQAIVDPLRTSVYAWFPYEDPAAGNGRNFQKIRFRDLIGFLENQQIIRWLVHSLAAETFVDSQGRHGSCNHVGIFSQELWPGFGFRKTGNPVVQQLELLFLLLDLPVPARMTGLNSI